MDVTFLSLVGFRHLMTTVKRKAENRSTFLTVARLGRGIASREFALSQSRNITTAKFSHHMKKSVNATRKLAPNTRP